MNPYQVKKASKLERSDQRSKKRGNPTGNPRVQQVDGTSSNPKALRAPDSKSRDPCDAKQVLAVPDSQQQEPVADHQELGKDSNSKAGAPVEDEAEEAADAASKSFQPGVGIDDLVDMICGSDDSANSQPIQPKAPTENDPPPKEPEAPETQKTKEVLDSICLKTIEHQEDKVPQTQAKPTIKPDPAPQPQMLPQAPPSAPVSSNDLRKLSLEEIFQLEEKYLEQLEQLHEAFQHNKIVFQ